MIRVSTRRTLLALALGGVCVAGSATPLVAQSSRDNQASSDVFKSEPVRTYDISFSGGTATEYIATVRQAHQNVNIVELSDLSMVVLPRVEMHNVSLEQAVNILDGATGLKNGTAVRLDVDLDSGRGTAPVFRIDARTLGRMANDGNIEDVYSRIWSVRDITRESGNADALLSAIEAALSLNEDQSTVPRIRFHRESGLLMARALEPDLETVESVIVEMMRNAQRPSSDSASKLRELQNKVNELSMENTHLTDKAHTSDSKSDAISTQNARLETRNRALESELQRAMDRIDHLTQQIIELKVQLGSKGGG